MPLTNLVQQLGAKIVDLNRVMKLIERGYTVRYDEKRHIAIAKKI